MRETLRKRCDLLIENEAVMRKAARLDFEEVTKLAALIIASRGRHAEEESIRACRKLLKSKAGIFSEFRGIMNSVVLAKMSLADDAEAYYREVDAVYRKLKTGTIFSYESQVMCALTICDMCPPDQREQVAERTLAAYAAARKAHPWLTDHNDLPLICLMVIGDRDAGEMNERAEECHELVKPLFKLYPETKQMISYVLALSDKPAREKVDIFWSLYQALRAAKRDMSRSYMISVLAAYVDVDVPQPQIVREIGEVDDVLHKAKGYGTLGVGGAFRRMMAAIVVLLDHAADAELANATSVAVVEAVAEQIMNAIITCIVVSSISASHSKS